MGRRVKGGLKSGKDKKFTPLVKMRKEIGQFTSKIQDKDKKISQKTILKSTQLLEGNIIFKIIITIGLVSVIAILFYSALTKEFDQQQMGSCYCRKYQKQTISVLTDQDQNNPSQHPKATEVNSQNIQNKRKGSQKKKVARQIQSQLAQVQNAQIEARQKTVQERQEITTSIRKVFLFHHLADQNLQAIINEMKLFILRPGEIVYNQGSKAENFYIVHNGTVTIEVSGEIRAELTKGQHFGQLALVHNSQRTATARTVNEVQLWGIDRQSFRQVVQSFNQVMHQENISFIRSIPLFEELTQQQEQNLVNLLVTQKFNDGERIIVEGDPGEWFYIVKEGSVTCTQQGALIREMSRGDFFGQQALIYNISRTASVTAIGPVVVLSLNRENLNAALGNSFEMVLFRNSLKIAFEKSPVFKFMNAQQIDNIISRTRVLHFQLGQKVIFFNEKKGERALIVLKGSLKSLNTRESYLKFSCIGDTQVFSGNQEVFREDFVASSQLSIAEITKFDLESALGGLLQAIQTKNKALRALKEINLLRNLPNKTIQKLADVLKTRQYHDKEKIVKQGDHADCFYIIKQGKVDVIVNGQTMRQIGENDYFGQRSILLKENRTATVIAVGQAQCWELNKSEFLALVGEGIRTQLLKRIELQDDSVRLNQLKCVKTLGKGSFGNVYLGVHTENNILYALKTILRSKIGVFDIYEGILLERRILLALDHPFITKLVKTFKDSHRLYLLMEYVRGQELFDVLRVMDLLNEEQSRFYISSIILILQHLHQRKIVYRDLKPENIMIDQEGYLKLIDFGTAKILTGRTFTVVGTPHYMAPQVLTGKGYTVSVDYWSMGVMLYEFICGKLPFGDDLEDPYAIYQMILKAKVHIPLYLKRYSRARAMVEMLLNKNPAYRSNSIQFKNHDWLASVDWDALISRHTKPPYIPRIGSLESQTQKALKNSFFLVDSVNKEEIQELAHPPRGRFKEGPPGWDDEF